VTGSLIRPHNELLNLYCSLNIHHRYTYLVKNLAASHWWFRNLIKTLGRTPLDE
jgi:hypothetical protein